MKNGLEFDIEIEEINDFEKFNNNKPLIQELQELVDSVSYGITIGFSDDNVLCCKGTIINHTKKECDSEYILFKEKYKRILKKYYKKFKIIDKMKLYFTKNF